MKVFHTILTFALAAFLPLCAQTQALPAPQNTANASAPLPVSISPLDGGTSQAAFPNTPPPADTPKEPVNLYENAFPEINDISDKIGVGFWEAYWHWVLAATVAVFVLLLAIFRKKTPPVATPYEAAVASLAEAEKNAAKIDAKEYGSRVSQAVRQYIGDARKIPAPERTTEEFLQIAASQDELFDAEQRARIEKILKLADMAKFARHSFKDGEKSELLASAREFVETDNASQKLAEKQKDSSDKTNNKTESATEKSDAKEAVK